jgi:hypothetical protein
MVFKYGVFNKEEFRIVGYCMQFRIRIGSGFPWIRIQERHNRKNYEIL